MSVLFSIHRQVCRYWDFSILIPKTHTKPSAYAVHMRENSTPRDANVNKSCSVNATEKRTSSWDRCPAHTKSDTGNWPVGLKSTVGRFQMKNLWIESILCRL